jgi:hypothetical protein
LPFAWAPTVLWLARLPTKKVTNLIVLERFLVVLQILNLEFWEAGSFFSLYQHFVFCKVHH